MAEVIERVGSRRSLYDWETWTNGKAYRAVRGKDFDVSTASFRSTLSVHAHRKGLTVRVSVDGDAVEFQFSKPKRKRGK